MPLNIALKSTVQRAAPTAGAVVKLTFDTENTGKTAVIRVKQANGKPLPFGADVFDADHNNVGTVAQGGRIVATSLKADYGTLNVAWGDAPEQRCVIDYKLPDMQQAAKTGVLNVSEGVCH